MAQVILSAAGQALGGPIGGALGRAIGAAADRALISSLSPARQVGPRLEGLSFTSTAEGAPMAAAFGRARVSGQVIWAARFSERRVAAASDGGKGGGGSFRYRYALSFAVALCEGPIDGVGRVWADGKPMDMTGVVMRAHLGTDDQAPDPLIKAIEGAAPAYRGTAYVVFEDLPLDAYGNRPPQLAFEVFRRPRPAGADAAMEDRLEGVCLIPGAGEFVYATEAVLRRDGLTTTAAETVNNSDGRPDLTVSLDQLAAQLPNVRHVTLVVAWFGDDLRAGHCAIRPGVEQAEKATLPYAWRAGGVDRDGARLISRTAGGGPAYGGTPSDRSVVQAITALKARGYTVTLYPFVMMDVPAGNGLPDPYGGAEQAAFPWRGRISCSPAPGRPASPDGTAAAAADVAALFGAARPEHFTLSGDEVGYAGPGEWSLRRLVLHCARLAQAAGGVESLLVGSELVGLTTVRSGPGAYPAVAHLRALAADCRAMLGPATRLGYAADWTEYFGHQPADGSGDVFFHLDPLWADGAIDFVGVDFYPPLTDWREGGAHLDAQAGYAGPRDPAYLADRVAGGEGFDWFYASDAARAAQARSPITDGAYGEPWVFRVKDLRGWWENAHHDRPGGVRASGPTAWVPRSKPLRLTEFGCPAVDKGANAPNLFSDPKSSERRLPPFSTGARDDLGQRRAMEAVLAHFAQPANNPVSEVYGGPMLERASAWCWDARPFPDFPAREAVWADAPNWSRGHWLNGRTGAAPVADLLAVLLERGGVGAGEVDLAGAQGLVAGFVVDRPMSLADAVAPLAQAFPFDLAERGGRLSAVARDGAASLALGAGDLALVEGEALDRKGARTLAPAPDGVRVRFIDGEANYQTGQALVRADAPGQAGVAALDLPVVMAASETEAVAARLLRRAVAERDTLTVNVGLCAALRAEPGDCVTLEGDGRRWRVLRADADERPRLTLVPAEAPDPVNRAQARWAASEPHVPPGPPVLHLLDLPPLPGFEEDARPIVAAAARPWRGVDAYAGADTGSLSLRASVDQPAVVGMTLSGLAAGPLFRIDRAARLAVRIEGGALASCTLGEALGGANACAVRTGEGAWEVLSFTHAELLDAGTYELSGLLRGQAGSDADMVAWVAPGAAFVRLEGGLARARMGGGERGLPLSWRATPAGAAAGGPAATETLFVWRGVADRPLPPAHLRLRREADGSLRLGWIRRARLHGDGLDGEPPLGEEAEAYRVDILADAAVVRTLQTGEPGALYGAGAQAVDFPAGTPNPLSFEVRQQSALWGWGAPARRALSW